MTVFLTGMHFAAPHRVDRWGPVFLAMPRMLRHLAAHPESGMLGHHLWFGRTTLLLSYWRSPQHLQAFARDANAPHLAPWRGFQALAVEGHVGVCHETYVASPGGCRIHLRRHAGGVRAGGRRGTGPGGPGDADGRAASAGSILTPPDGRRPG